MPYLTRQWRFLSFYSIGILGTSSLSPRGDDRSDKHHVHGAGYPIGHLESICQLFVNYLSIICQLFVKDELFFWKKTSHFYLTIASAATLSLLTILLPGMSSTRLPRTMFRHGAAHYKVPLWSFHDLRSSTHISQDAIGVEQLAREWRLANITATHCRDG